jgi:hypothetical protein
MRGAFEDSSLYLWRAGEVHIGDPERDGISAIFRENLPVPLYAVGFCPVDG